MKKYQFSGGYWYLQFALLVFVAFAFPTFSFIATPLIQYRLLTLIIILCVVSFGSIILLRDPYEASIQENRTLYLKSRLGDTLLYLDDIIDFTVLSGVVMRHKNGSITFCSGYSGNIQLWEFIAQLKTDCPDIKINGTYIQMMLDDIKASPNNNNTEQG